MKLGVLHLSDIHFRRESDPARKYGESIAKACYATAHQSDEFIIVVTGDIAFGGKAVEYGYAAELFSTILSALKAEIGRPVNIFLAPGNHDCALLPEDEIRSLTIDKVVELQGSELRLAWIEKCTEAQAEYYKFESMVRVLEPVFEDRLWKEFELQVGDGVLRVSSINAAWMSKLHESQG